MHVPIQSPDNIGSTGGLLGLDFWDFLPIPNLGKYSFLYQFYINDETLKKFMDVTEVEMWKHLEYAFLGKETGTWYNPGSRVLDGIIRTAIYPFTQLLRALGFDTKYGLKHFQAYRVKKYWLEVQGMKNP